MITLPNSELQLRLLLDYLIAEHGLNFRKFSKLCIVHSEEQDIENQKDPRVFCFVQRNTPRIYATVAMERLPADACVGVLLHEIGHLALDAFNGDDSEVDVDEWCMFTVPESNYHYRDCAYISPWADFSVTAKNLEHVKHDFLARIT